MSEAIEIVRKAIQQGKMAGSWLVSGGYEYEKKSFISECCSLLFGQDFNDISTFHPDIKWLECGLTEAAKKEVQKNILAGKALTDENALDKKREITIDDIREGIRFLSMKGTNSCRVLVINPADKMNEDASNALLKILEEPPEKCVIFLLCQNKGKLLPTIKSRCRKLVLPFLPKEKLKQQIQELFPALEEVDLVLELSEGSIGLAREICELDGVAMYHELSSLFIPSEQLAVERVNGCIDNWTDTPEKFDLFKRFILNKIVQEVKKNALTNPFKAEDWIDLYDETLRLFADIDSIYLDKKQVLQVVLFKMAERFS